MNSPYPFPFLKDGDAPPVKYLGTAVSDNGYAARIFLPSGTLADRDSPSSIRLVKGNLDLGSVVYTRGSPKNYYDITLISDTGRIKIDRP